MEKEIGWLLGEKYSGKPSKQFYKDLERLEAGEPLDYVIGFTEFLGCKIDLSKKTLIPRIETEYWVEKEITKIKNNSKVLDIFSGSGCIGLAILKNVKSAKVVFVDKEKKAIDQIRINLKLNKIKSTVVQSNVFSKVIGKYDYIFANPPYISKTKINKIQKSVLRYEPKLALFGGSDGFLYIIKFLKDAKKYLNDGGKIFMEFDCTQKKEIEKLFKKCKYSNYEFYKDQFNRWRWVEIG
jgi:release factor glutamine methyltransferase